MASAPHGELITVDAGGTDWLPLLWAQSMATHTRSEAGLTSDERPFLALPTPVAK